MAPLSATEVRIRVTDSYASWRAVLAAGLVAFSLWISPRRPCVLTARAWSANALTLRASSVAVAESMYVFVSVPLCIRVSVYVCGVQAVPGEQRLVVCRSRPSTGTAS